ncbi:MAG TPA: hypothetical protein VLA68_01195, partial [Nitrososphaera sp.]|nr:hypothetical protein [Nitrososphaera sp.]
GLYYFFLLGVFQILSQILGFSGYSPHLGDDLFSVVLAITAIGYFYLLSSYITLVARRKKIDVAGLVMMASIAAIFVSPYLIATFQSAATAASTKVVPLNIADRESCVSFPQEGGSVEWEEGSRTCSISGTFNATGHDMIGVAREITLEILPGGNITIVRFVNNNGTILVNGGILQNIEGYIYNYGLLYHNSGTLINRGFIESDRVPDPEGYPKNWQGGKILNNATIENRHYIYNHGEFTNLGLVINTGQIQLFDSSEVYNNGTIWNNGRIEIAGEFNNFEEIENSGTMVVYRYLESSITDQYRVTHVNNFGEIVNSVGELHNSSVLNNHGTIINQLGEFSNRLDETQAVINNGGTISNIAGTVTNDGIFRNDCDGRTEGSILGNAIVDICP